MIQTYILRSRYQAISGPDIIKELRDDSVIFFVFITTSHLVIMIMFGAVRVGLPESV